MPLILVLPVAPIFLLLLPIRLLHPFYLALGLLPAHDCTLSSMLLNLKELGPPGTTPTAQGRHASRLSILVNAIVVALSFLSSVGGGAVRFPS